MAGATPPGAVPAVLAVAVLRPVIICCSHEQSAEDPGRSVSDRVSPGWPRMPDGAPVRFGSTHREYLARLPEETSLGRILLRVVCNDERHTPGPIDLRVRGRHLTDTASHYVIFDGDQRRLINFTGEPGIPCLRCPRPGRVWVLEPNRLRALLRRRDRLGHCFASEIARRFVPTVDASAM